MNTAQLDHLKRIDAHLERLIETAKKRIPGKWWLDDPHDGGIRAEDDHVLLRRESWLDDEDAVFIASCAGNAEAGWIATRAAIAHLLEYDNLGVTMMSETTRRLLASILEAWPLTLLEP